MNPPAPKRAFSRKTLVSQWGIVKIVCSNKNSNDIDWSDKLGYYNSILNNYFRQITQTELYSSAILAVARIELPWYHQLAGVPKKTRIFKNEPSELMKKYGKVIFELIIKSKLTDSKFIIDIL